MHKLRNLGRFTFTRHQLYNGHLEALQAVFGSGIVLHMISNFATDTIEYTMHSPKHFEKVEEGALIPEYEFDIEYLSDSKRDYYNIVAHRKDVPIDKIRNIKVA